MHTNLLLRFWQYQKERYPFLVYIFLIGSFSFSAIGFSLIARFQITETDLKIIDFISWDKFIVCIITNVMVFFLLRVFDEHKDYEDDILFRKELPIPRGLLTLKELRIFGYIGFIIISVINAILFHKMLILLAFVLIYMLLMGREFFIANWLKKHQFWYVVSHMFIIPFVDVFASGYDWFLQNTSAPIALIWFFIVSYFNGLVLEIGRKIRIPEKEQEGVLTYSKMLGIKKAPMYFILLLFLTAIFATIACLQTHQILFCMLLIWFFFILCATPAVIFLKTQTEKNAKFIEYASALWTFVMYLFIGGIPYLYVSIITP